MIRNSIKLDDGYGREYFLIRILMLYVNFERDYI